MTDVRAKQLETGHELSVDEDWAKQFPKAYEILLDEDGSPRPGRDRGGEVIPPKYHVTVEEAAAKKVAAGAKPYLERRKAELEAEVSKRNADRDEGDQIVVASPGNKPELAAALEADDDAATPAATPEVADSGSTTPNQDPSGDTPAGQGDQTEEN